MSKKSPQSLADELKPFVAPFRFDGSGTFHLKSHKTNEKGGLDKDKAERQLLPDRARFGEVQEKLYDQDRWSLLLIFQGTASESARIAVSSISAAPYPQGCEVHAFKQ